MSDGTKVVRFVRTEKYQCDGTVHVYREGDVHRFIDDFADKWVTFQAAQVVDEEEFADLELTPRPEPRVPGAPKSADPVPESVFEKPRRGRPVAIKPIVEEAPMVEVAAAVAPIALKADEPKSEAAPKA